jgi:hypothetical protein
MAKIEKQTDEEKAAAAEAAKVAEAAAADEAAEDLRAERAEAGEAMANQLVDFASRNKLNMDDFLTAVGLKLGLISR